jgi:hypothetical protein
VCWSCVRRCADGPLATWPGPHGDDQHRCCAGSR